MRGSSRTSLLEAKDQLESVVAHTDAMRLGEDLFAAAGTLRDSPRLRRAFTDPSRSSDGKAEGVSRLFGGKLSEVAVETLQGLFRRRWSAPEDALAAVEVLGAESVLAAAEQQGQLDEVSEQLFLIERTLIANGQLEQSAGDTRVDASRRSELLRNIFGSRISPVAATLVDQAVRRSGSRKIGASLKEFSEQAIARQGRSVARVEAAIPLSDEQLLRLQQALERIYGRAIHVNVDVVPEIVGGMRVRVGEEVIDASIVNRLDTARRRFTD